MDIERLIPEYSRVISTAANPVGLIQYFSNDAQTFCIKDGEIHSEETLVVKGDWSLHDDLSLLYGAPIGYNSMRLDHPCFGAVFGISDSMTFHVYVYAEDIGDLVDTMELTEQTDNQIKGLSFSLLNTSNVLFESEASLFVPGAQVNVALTMGDEEEYFPMGTYFMDSVPFDLFSSVLSYQGRSGIARLKDSTFDTINSITQASFIGSYGDIAVAILERYSGGEISADNIIVNLTGAWVEAVFLPSDNVLDGLNKWLTSIGWAMEELYDGRYIIGARTGLIKTYRPSNRYTFTRESDVFTRRIDKSGDGAYARVGVKYGDPVKYTYAEIESHPYWYTPPNKTLYMDAPESSTYDQAQVLALAKAAEMSFVGIKEQCVGLLRPELLVGDITQIQEDGVNTVTGVVTETKHQMGSQGFFTTFVTDSGGVILADDGKDIAVAITSSVWGANRARRVTDFLRKPVSARSGDTGAVGQAGTPGQTGASGEVGPPGATGATGAQGPIGLTGATGAPGAGLPAGGTIGQIITKKSVTDYDTQWSDRGWGGDVLPIADVTYRGQYFTLFGGEGDVAHVCKRVLVEGTAVYQWVILA